MCFGLNVRMCSVLTPEPINRLIFELEQTLFQQSLGHLLTSSFFKMKKKKNMFFNIAIVWLCG